MSSLGKKHVLNGTAAGVALLFGLMILLGVGTIPAAHAVTSSVVQTAKTEALCSTPTCTVQASFPTPVASGDAIVMSVDYDHFTPLNSLNDSFGTSFTIATSPENGDVYAAIGYGTLGFSGPDTVTATLPDTCYPCTSNIELYIFEVSGVTTAGAVTASGSGAGFTATASTTSTTSTTFQPGAFLVSMVSVMGTLETFTAPSPWTVDSQLLSAATYATSGVSSPTPFPVTINVPPIFPGIVWTEEALALNPIQPVTTTSTATDTVTQTETATATTTSTSTTTATQLTTTTVTTGNCFTETTQSVLPHVLTQGNSDPPTVTSTTTTTTTGTVITTTTLTQTVTSTSTLTGTVIETTCATSTPSTGVPQFPLAGLGAVTVVALSLPALLLVNRLRSGRRPA